MDENGVFADLKKLALAHAKVSCPTIDCPECGKKFDILMRENLDPYTMTLAMESMPGRAIDAKTLGAQIKTMARLFESLGKDYGHETMSVVLGVEVDDQMTTKITMAFVPKKLDVSGDETGDTPGPKARKAE